MSLQFEDLTRAAARGHTRRGIIKLFGGAAATAVVATVVKPFRADATCDGTPCGPNCCAPGVACLNASTGTCGCGARQVQCGTNRSNPSQPYCCSGTCANAATNCCCATGTTPCGTACCAKGVACLDKSNGTCGCPAGYTSCGGAANLTCCAAGKACGDPSCQPAGGLGGRVASTCPPPPWVPFSFYDVGTTAVTFVVNGPATLYVTDAYCVGDQFEVLDGSTSLGTTSAVPNVCNCSYAGATGDPDTAYADPTYSHGSYSLGAGTHTISINVAQSPCGGGGAYYRVV